MDLLLLESIAMHIIEFVVIFFFLNIIFQAFDFFFIPVLQIIFSLCMPLLVSIIIYFMISLAIKKGGFIRSAFNTVLRIIALLICLVVFAVAYVEIPFKELVQYGKWALGISVTLLFVLKAYIAIRKPD